MEKITHSKGFFYECAHFLGGVTILTYDSIKALFRRPFYFRLLIDQIYNVGASSILLIVVTGLATGSVMALQFGWGLTKFGGTLYIPKLVSLSIFREMGPVFASLMLAARVGSGMAAEISSMKVTQQIDAIRALGTSPIKKLVIPRVLATIISLPLLTIIVDFVALFSAMLVSLSLGIGPYFFVEKVTQTMTYSDILSGEAKTVFFGYLISIIACYRGLHAEGGTRGVGNVTTWVVVVASISIMVSDFFLTKLFIEIF